MQKMCDHPPRLRRHLLDGPVVLCAQCCMALGEDCKQCGGEGFPAYGIACSQCNGQGWMPYRKEART